MTRYSKQTAVLALLALIGGVSGCSLSFPARLIDGVNFVTAKYHVRDAKAQWVEQWPGLRVDSVIAADLEAALANDDLPTVKSLALRFLDGGHDLALATTRNELDRLSDEGWRELAAQYFQAETDPTDDAKQQIIDIFTEETDLHHLFLTQRIREAQSIDQVHELLAQIDQGVEQPVKYQGRVARAAPFAVMVIPSMMAAMAEATINANEWHGDLDAAFETVVQYNPAAQAMFDSPENEPDHWGLLVKYAPVIIQEQPGDVYYPRTDDQFGRVYALDDQSIHIDVGRPTVYAYARQIRLNGRPHTQLCYTYWYPEHPPLKGFDPEAGKIEGVTMRITLDGDDRPMLFETVYNCGCYHRVYPSQALEEACKEKYGRPQFGKKYSIERNVLGKIDLIVPKAVHVPQDAGRPILRSRAGWHAIVDIAFDDHHREPRAAPDRAYTLLPYDELERLTMPNGRMTSMFYDNGLVRGAQRMEGIFFTPIGMLSAGQPRQRGTQLIHWDHYDFDDPKLLVKALRLPDVF